MNTPKLQSELLYEYTGRLTGVTEYGVSLGDVLAGQVQPPAAGMRVDIAFEGDVSGRIQGSIRGVDYLNIHADGRMELDLRGTIMTGDGARITLAADGVALPQAGSSGSLLRENVRLSTNCSDYAWLRPLQIWAVGTADPVQGTLHVRGYLPA